MIEKARKLGVRNIAIHKGLAFGPQSYEHSTCVDIGRVAKRYPDVNFLIYHSGFVTDADGRPVRPEAHRRRRRAGARALPRTASSPDTNVYAELGSTWRFAMRDPDTAAHALGKLFKYCGEDNVLWGTDSIWYGSPQDQIQAFRTFQIAPELRAKHGYPEITPALRAKVFGLNALRIYPVPDDVLHKHCEGSRRAGPRGISPAPRSGLPHLRAADAARVPQPQGVGRLSASISPYRRTPPFALSGQREQRLPVAVRFSACRTIAHALDYRSAGMPGVIPRIPRPRLPRRGRRSTPCACRTSSRRRPCAARPAGRSSAASCRPSSPCGNAPG